MNSHRGGSPILNTLEKFSRRDNCKESTLKPPNYHRRREELENQLIQI